ncbi:vWA domain-containing protein [Caldisalinibacter kiritimatiensis]|uniref:VWFA domain-containing protein n=1 Tax=Caldisalinibacter kiritimatiensis TaxID=1304284 RepID=R1CWY8_9FIRM|nr:vWA domain-containing protein [Caldisalinibacter kiritimatiensis]EOD01139.1 hypothetical protein L21TH_0807 [Caldisalinibacter kiritimatiensis]
MEKTIKFRQVILVTDGQSNVGCDPVEVARQANNEGIIVNTIGIVNDRQNEEPLLEIQRIAGEGGGVWELTDINNLSRTMEMVTQKSVYKTIEETVNKELKQILGEDIENIHPDSRKKIIDIIDKLGEEANIRCCIVLDSSGSMSKKINIAKNSILNLLRVLKGRKGKTEIAVIAYPGKKDQIYQIISGLTEDINELERKLSKIEVGGMTPTGLALKKAIEILIGVKQEEIVESNIV